MAVGLMLNAKKGLSAKQMERDLGVSYKTAWYLCHRIRKAMDENGVCLPERWKWTKRMLAGAFDNDARKRERYDKMPVLGMIERGDKSTDTPSQVKVEYLPSASRYHIYPHMFAGIAPIAERVVTDESRFYNTLHKHYNHKIVNHSAKQWVKEGDIHTNGIEGFWSLFKRGVIGSFHKVSIKHLDRYLNEFEYRFNHRKEQDIYAMVMINLVIQTGIRYKQLTAPVAPSFGNSISAQSSDEPF